MTNIDTFFQELPNFIEMQFLLLAAKRLTNAERAAALGVKKFNLDSYARRIKQKMNPEKQYEDIIKGINQFHEEMSCQRPRMQPLI